MEHTDMKISLESKLQISSICSLRIRSRKLDIFEKPQHLSSNPSVEHFQLFLPIFRTNSNSTYTGNL